MRSIEKYNIFELNINDVKACKTGRKLCSI